MSGGKKMKEVLERIEKLSHEKSDSLAEKMKDFAEFAPFYDDDIAALEYSAPQRAAKVLSDVVEEDSHCDKGAMSIIDFAAGTGLVCKHLRELGFSGAIDGQDGSDAMLAIGAPLYSRTFCFILEEGAKIPPELSGGGYDASVMCGGFSPSQVGVGCLRFMVDSVRCGGYVVFTTRLNPSNLEFAERLEKKCSDLEEEGTWKLLSRLRVENFELTTNENEKTSKSNYIPGVVLCYQKIVWGHHFCFQTSDSLNSMLINLWVIFKIVTSYSQQSLLILCDNGKNTFKATANKVSKPCVRCWVLPASIFFGISKLCIC